jgi:Fe-S-cluster-containing dehydrogenase component
MKILTTPRLERCIGCHSCSLACARLGHQRLSWDMAGIRVASSGGFSTGFEARTCLACNPVPCAAACPTGAYAQRRGGGVIVRKNLCIRCGECARACPVGCIHIGFSREKFQADYRYFYRQVSYDHEPIFATGSMLGVTNCFAVLDIIDVVEQMGLDA